MHLADGLITNPGIALGVSALGLTGLGAAVREVRRTHAAPRLAWAGTLGAFVLAAQAINVPLLPGVSAHVIGSALLTLVIGPALAVLVLTCVLMVQAVLLGDGGITMLGVNTVTLALIPVGAMSALRALQRPGQPLRAWHVVLGTVLGNTLGATVLAGVLAAGAGAPWGPTLGWLVAVQGLAGLAEGILSHWAWRALSAKNAGAAPDSGSRRLSLDHSDAPASSASAAPSWRWAALAVGVLLALIPWSSSRPDALEVVVERLSP